MSVIDGNESILNLLLDNGGDVNKVDAFGMAPVFLAIRYAKPPILLSVLQHNPDRSALFDGDTALHYAVRENKITHAELLISYDYSTECTNRDGISPIQLAQRLNYMRILSVMDNPVNRQKLAMMPKQTRERRVVEPIKDEEPKPAAPPQPAPQPAAPEPANHVEKEMEDPIPSVTTWGSKPPVEPVKPEPQPQPMPMPSMPPYVEPQMPAMPMSMGYQQYVTVPAEEYAMMQRRLTILEQLARQVLSGQKRLCHVCNSRPGTNKCPVCGKPFCTQDWAAHVAQGCHVTH